MQTAAFAAIPSHAAPCLLLLPLLVRAQVLTDVEASTELWEWDTEVSGRLAGRANACAPRMSCNHTCRKRVAPWPCALVQVMAAALDLHDHVLREYMEKHCGYEVQTEGDAFLIAFHEPHDAVAWCAATQLALLGACGPAICALAGAQAPGQAGLRGAGTETALNST